MSSRPPTLQALFAEMKRRRVFKVMAVYGAVAFVILQVADIAFEPLGLPAWTMTFVLVLAMIGFPIAIVLAWAFESTPEGVRRTAPAADEEIRQIVAEPRSSRWPSGLLALASMVLLFGTGWWMGGSGRDDARAPNLLGVSEAQASGLRTLAALPFENVNATDENRLIAFGIHDDLLTQLSRIGALRVTSRTSVRDLGDSELSLREIAELLGVEYILEGSVRSAGSQVRVNVTLVDVASGETMWGAQYDEEVTPENLLDIQGHISRQVVAELETQLTPEEDAALASMRPAASSVAQQWYYRAMDAYTASPEGARRARDAMRRAVEADSGYVAAWSQLATFESRLTWIGEDRQSDARAAMERTEALAPGSVEAHLARGYFEYYARRNFDAALSAFRAAERLAPSEVDAKVAVGLILRRQGEWEASTEAMKAGVQLDPRNVDPLAFLAENLGAMGAYGAADVVIERGLTVDPTDAELRADKVVNLVHLDRDAGRARRLADELALDPGELEEAGVLAGLAELAGDYERGLGLLEQWRGSETDFLRAARSLHRARTFRLMEDPASARASADTALAYLDEISLEGLGLLGTTTAGRAHALAGRREQAMPLLAEAEREVRSWEDHVDPTTRALGVVEAYGFLGEIDRGLDLLEELIDRPAMELSVSALRLGPGFDPYRGDPRFEELVERRERFEAEGARWAEANGPWLP